MRDALKLTKPRWALTLLALAASIPLIFDAPARAESAPDKPAYRRFELEIGGRITDVSSEDLDGDGLKDLLVIRGRELQVFFQGPEGFRASPDQRWNFDRRAVLFDTIDLGANGRRSILFLTGDGVYTYELKGARSFGLLKVLQKRLDTLTRRPSRDEIRRKDLCRDLNGDGREDLLIPEASGLAIYLNEQGRFGERVPLFVPPSATISPGSDRLSSSSRTVYWYSNPTVADFDQDGRGDLLLPVGDRLKVFKQRAGASPFAARPDLSLAVPFQKQLAAGQRPDFDLDVTMPLRLTDLDADGFVDMVSTHIGQGLTRIFMGSKTSTESLKSPRQTIRAKGVSFFSFTIDLNGDGLKDLVIPRTDKIGIWFLVKVLVTRKVSVEMLTFYQRAEGAEPFPREPDFVGEVDIPVLLRSGGERMSFGTSFLASISGDYNGDGRNDILYRDDDGALGLFFAKPGREGYPDDASLTVPMKDPDAYRFIMADTPDMDGDRRSDIILKYYSWDRTQDRLSVYLSSDRPKR